MKDELQIEISEALFALILIRISVLRFYIFYYLFDDVFSRVNYRSIALNFTAIIEW
jgi:hypothetical protein